MRQVPCSQTLHSCRSSALLFKPPYRSFSKKSSITLRPIRLVPDQLLLYHFSINNYYFFHKFHNPSRFSHGRPMPYLTYTLLRTRGVTRFWKVGERRVRAKREKKIFRPPLFYFCPPKKLKSGGAYAPPLFWKWGGPKPPTVGGISPPTSKITDLGDLR